MHPAQVVHGPVETVLRRHATPPHGLLTEPIALQVDREDFIDEFLTNCHTEWLHVFENAAASLREFGHNAEVELQTKKFQEGIVMGFYPKFGVSEQSAHASIKLMAHEATGQVLCHVVIDQPTPNSVLTVHFAMKELTNARLEEEIARNIDATLIRLMPFHITAEKSV
jgi:hypothetical protein